MSAFFLFFSFVLLQAAKTAPIVRVLLDTLLLPCETPVEISTAGTCIRVHAGKKRDVIKSNRVAITVKRGAVHIGAKKYGSSLELSSDGYLSYGGRAYHGTLRLPMQGKQVMVINHVPLEEYICSVLKTESWPGWPLEVNKVFAVTSRTYALYMMQKAQKEKRPFDVYNTKKHQTYSGVHDTKILSDAVHQTRGMILVYQDKPILAMFDSCCGGIIPARMEEINFEEAPYLARTYPCTYCKSCWIFNWKASCTMQELSDRLFGKERSKKKIRSMRITKKDPAGIIREVEIAAGTKKRITGKELYTALDAIKSFAFSIAHEKDRIIFHGRGYGHHIGLCQWGAREMVRAGWNYKRILHFYYPGTTLGRL